MTIHLYSVDHAPRNLPIWQTILEDLGHPPAARVARVLGVGIRTVHRWNVSGQAPRPAQMALFWLTRWGRSAVHAQATNDAILACGYVASLRREVDRLGAQLAHVMQLGQTGASNDPVQGAGHAPTLLP